MIACCRGRSRAASDVTEEELRGSAPKIRVEAMVLDGLADQVVRVIRDAAHTGTRGDGKVYVAPLEYALRIGTGEHDDSAV